MVDKVKCGNKDCKLFDVVVPVSNLYINRIAPLDGPWPCPECREEMKIAHVIPNSYKGNSSKSMPKRITTSQTASRTVGKKPARRKSVKRKVAYAAGAANGTVNRELAILRRGFRLGERFGKVSRVPHFDMLAESKPRSGFLDEAQYRALVEACVAAKQAPWLRAFVEVAGQLSNRRGELLALNVRDVDFLGDSITLAETKNGERRTIPMTPSVRALLEIACAEKRANAYVFTWPDGRQVRDFRESWRQGGGWCAVVESP